jgi:hypothetical protein
MKVEKQKYILSGIVILVALILAGCAGNSDNENDNSFSDTYIVRTLNNDYVYRSELVSFPVLPDGRVNISNVVLTYNTIFFTASSVSNEANASHSPAIFTMDVDGTNLLELSNYEQGLFPDNGQKGEASINILYADGNENLWTVESRGIYGSDLPEDFGGSIIRKLDRTGAEISKIDVSNLSGGNVWVHAFIVDDEGYIYIASGARIYVLDNS